MRNTADKENPRRTSFCWTSMCRIGCAASAYVLNKLDELSRLDKPAREILRFRKQDAWLEGDEAAAAMPKSRVSRELRLPSRQVSWTFTGGCMAWNGGFGRPGEPIARCIGLAGDSEHHGGRPAKLHDGEAARTRRRGGRRLSCQETGPKQAASEDECTARARRISEDRPPQKAALDAGGRQTPEIAPRALAEARMAPRRSTPA